MDDAADALGQGEADALLDGLEGEAATLGGELAGDDRLAFGAGLEGGQGGPFGVFGGDFGQGQAWGELVAGGEEGGVAADHQQLERAGGDAVLQAGGGLDDDLGADAGGVAHGDGEVSGHWAVLSGMQSRSRSRPGGPNAPDLERMVTPSQMPPRRRETGTAPGHGAAQHLEAGSAEGEAEGA